MIDLSILVALFPFVIVRFVFYEIIIEDEYLYVDKDLEEHSG